MNNNINLYGANCRHAIKSDDVETLYKYLPALKDAMASPSFDTEFLPNLLADAAQKNAHLCFRYILENSTNFSNLDSRKAYRFIIEKREYDLIENYWRNAKKHMSPQEYETITQKTCLDHAFNNQDLEMIKFLVERGADIKATNSSGSSLFMPNAIDSNNLEILKFLLDQGVTSAPLHGRIHALMRDKNNKDIVPFIDLLLEYGHLTPDRFTLDKLVDIQDWHGGYHLPAPREAINHVRDTFYRWQKRSQFERFPVTFKPAMKLEHLSNAFNTAAGVKTTALHSLARSDRFEEAVTIAIRDKNHFSANMLFQKDGRGDTVIDILGARNRLQTLNKSILWQDHMEEFNHIVNKTPPVYRAQLSVNNMDTDLFSNDAHQKKKNPLKR